MESPPPLEWYSVKGLFRWASKGGGSTLRVEERVVLFRAASFEHALGLAEAEAERYCADDPGATWRIEPMGRSRAYRLDEERVGSGTEVYARLVNTRLDAEAFLRRYHPASHEKRERD